MDNDIKEFKRNIDDFLISICGIQVLKLSFYLLILNISRNRIIIGDSIMPLTTKLYNNNQTVIPSEIRKKFNVKPNDIIEWIINDKGKIEINFRKKVDFEDIYGIITEEIPYNAVELKKMAHDNSKLKRL